MADNQEDLPLIPLGQPDNPNALVVTTANFDTFISGVSSGKMRLLELECAQGKDYEDFGEAVRNGNPDCASFIQRNGRAAFEARFAFQARLKRLPSRSDADLTMVAPSIIKLEVTALQLAVIGKREQIVRIMLEEASKIDHEMLREALEDEMGILFRASLELYSKFDQTLAGLNVLHLAARYHSDSLIVILDFIKCRPFFQDLVECKSKDLNHSPMHMAARNRNLMALKVLLQYVGNVDQPDNREFTALHIACKLSYVPHVAILLENGANPNAWGENRQTPLHRTQSPKIARLLMQHQSDPSAPMINRVRGERWNASAFEVLLARNPIVANEVLSYGVTSNDKDFHDPDFLIVFDLRLFRQLPDFAGQIANKDKGELSVHAKLIYLHVYDLLKSPLSEAFMHLKWEMTKRYFFVNAIFHVFLTTFVTALTCTATIMMRTCREGGNSTVEKHNEVEPIRGLGLCIYSENTYISTLRNNSFWAFFVLSFVAIFLLLLREAIQALFSWTRFLREAENYLEAALATCSVVYMILIFSHFDLSQHFGAIALLCAWVDLMLKLGRFPILGRYIYMAVHVSWLLLGMFSVYCFALLGFSFAFQVLLPDTKAFDNPISASVKVLVMMIGEFDFEDNFNWSGFGISTQLFFIIFIFVVTITISNLLTGLTVSKTEELFKEAGIIRQRKSVMEIMGLEAVLEGIDDVLGRKNSTTQVFSYLRNLANLNNFYNHQVEEVNKICVRPSELRRNNLLLYNTEKLTSVRGIYNDVSCPVYLYDEQTGSLGRYPVRLKMTLPGSVVQGSLEMLKSRKASEEIQNDDDL